MIRLNPLLGLVWVARFESYAKAARAFPHPISQPGLHQQVRSLEAEIGTRLFTRVGKDRVVLTTTGRALVELCEPFIEGLEEFLHRQSLGHANALRIQSSGLVLRGVVAPFAAALRRAAPDVRLLIEEIRRPTAQSVANGETDLLIDFVPELPRGVSSMSVSSASAYLVLPRSHPLARRKRVTLSAVGNADFVAYPKNTLHRQLQERTLDRASACPAKITEASTADSILALVAAGLGYSIIPSLDPASPKQRGVVAHRIGRRGMFSIKAVFRDGGREDPAIAAALSCFSKLA